MSEWWITFVIIGAIFIVAIAIPIIIRRNRPGARHRRQEQQNSQRAAAHRAAEAAAQSGQNGNIAIAVTEMQPVQQPYPYNTANNDGAYKIQGTNPQPGLYTATTTPSNINSVYHYPEQSPSQLPPQQQPYPQAQQPYQQAQQPYPQAQQPYPQAQQPYPQPYQASVGPPQYQQPVYSPPDAARTTAGGATAPPPTFSQTGLSVYDAKSIQGDLPPAYGEIS